MSQRVATIDLGSNSCVLLVLESVEDRVVRVTSDVALTRLSEGLDASGVLSDAAMDRSLKALGRFAARARALGASSIHAVGTAALREASNQEIMIKAAHDLGINLRPITGLEEASLSFAAAQYGSAGPCLMIDIGGASTELAWGGDQGFEGRASLSVGSVRLTERLGLKAPMDADQSEQLMAACRDVFQQAPSAIDAPLVAVAGTATTAAQLYLGLSGYDPDLLDQQVLGYEALLAMYNELCACSVQERMQEWYLSEGRADVFPAGLALLITALESYQQDRLVVRDRGVAWGEGLRHFS